MSFFATFWLADKGVETVYTFDQKHFQRSKNLKASPINRRSNQVALLRGPVF
jgi:hypothetical protein